MAPRPGKRCLSRAPTPGAGDLDTVLRRGLAQSVEETTRMPLLHAVAGIVAVGLAVYLVIALLAPERFS